MSDDWGVAREAAGKDKTGVLLKRQLRSKGLGACKRYLAQIFLCTIASTSTPEPPSKKQRVGAAQPDVEDADSSKAQESAVDIGVGQCRRWLLGQAQTSQVIELLDVAGDMVQELSQMLACDRKEIVRQANQG